MSKPWSNRRCRRLARLVEHYTSMGDKTALCTATYDFVSKAVARVLGIDFTLAVKPEENDKGEFTGRPGLGSVLFRGQGRLRARRDQGCGRCRHPPMRAFTFIPTRWPICPFFEFVESLGGTCFAVNPEKKLEALAAEHDWEVLRTFDAQESRALEEGCRGPDGAAQVDDGKEKIQCGVAASV